MGYYSLLRNQLGEQRGAGVDREQCLSEAPLQALGAPVWPRLNNTL